MCVCVCVCVKEILVYGIKLFNIYLAVWKQLSSFKYTEHHFFSLSLSSFKGKIEIEIKYDSPILNKIFVYQLVYLHVNILSSYFLSTITAQTQGKFTAVNC